MKKVELKDAKPYQAPKHFGMTALRLHGREETGSQTFWVGLSRFLPGGGAEFDASPAEKVYFVLEGEVTIKCQSGEVNTLGPWDSIYIGAEESRAIVNETNQPASMLVIIGYTE
ncbi:MAG: cupin domain-containing protein [Actinobacteria bacterium]|nr:MAG: cupin domain-containing protein [Actinomycetota bacterium]